MESFWYWLKKQKKRQDPVGDLSRDLMADPELGGGDHGCGVLAKYLKDRGVGGEVFDALDTAWREYVREEVGL